MSRETEILNRRIREYKDRGPEPDCFDSIEVATASTDQQKWEYFRTDEKQSTLYQKQREHVRQHPASRIKNPDYCLYSFRSDIFSTEDIDKLIEVGDSLEQSEATVYEWGAKINHTVRKSNIGWLIPPEHIPSLIPNIIKIWDGRYKHFENIQYASYGVGGHFQWHRDQLKTPMMTTKRVTTGVVQLSDPSEYEGGVLEIDDTEEIIPVEKKKGLVTLMPIDIFHRVTPVTSGIRKSLVIWPLGDSYPEEEF